MTSALWLSILIWCAVFNYLALIVAFGGFVLAHDWLYRFHSRWFKLSIPQFDAMAYLILGLYKLAIWFFLIIPVLAICYVNKVSAAGPAFGATVPRQHQGFQRGIGPLGSWGEAFLLEAVRNPIDRLASNVSSREAGSNDRRLPAPGLSALRADSKRSSVRAGRAAPTRGPTLLPANSLDRG